MHPSLVCRCLNCSLITPVNFTGKLIEMHRQVFRNKKHEIAKNSMSSQVEKIGFGLGDFFIPGKLFSRY